jgi:dUTP pyrophosphatase
LTRVQAHNESNFIHEFYNNCFFVELVYICRPKSKNTMFKKIHFKKHAEDVQLPKYESPGAAGFDIRFYEKNESAREVERILTPGTSLVFDTGLYPEVPEGYELEIRPRSGLAFKHDITLSNSPGTIDADYRGEIRVKLINLGKNSVSFKHGDRICQGLLKEAKQWIILEAKELSETLRGSGGYGSTGLN